jgi:peptidoglycan LD-endopeptidase LytH
MRITILALIFSILSTLPSFASSFNDWNTLDKANRDATIDRAEARREIIALDKQLQEEYSGRNGIAPYRFPVKGYGRGSAGGKNGSDYQPAGYDFYGGNRHGGHPAHDLFIHDKGETGLDSGTEKPAEVVAFANGVVIGSNPAWEHPSKIRGGIYLWIFNPESNRYYYYAHLAKIMVAPGDIVKAGETIALLGRTGKNAWPKRSPTHLHFMCLSFDNGRMTPHDTWREFPDAEANLPAALPGESIGKQ